MQPRRDCDPLSWRDPDGFVVQYHDRILRAVNRAKADQTLGLLATPWMTRLIAEGVICATTVLMDPPPTVEGAERWLWLEHDVLPFPCYPHEITALQLYDAGQLTLKIAIEAAEHAWVLKDASAWNVLHSQGRAVFVDFLSFDKQETTGTWIAYGQFVRHYVVPLLLYRKLGITPTEIFLTHRDGIVPERAYELLHGPKLLSASALEFIVLPKLLAPAGARLIAARSTRKPRTVDSTLGTRLLLSTLRRLQRTLEALRPDRSKSESVWQNYEEDRAHYSDADLMAKTAFVRRHLNGSQTILDLGCNAGEFSLIAAATGKTVVAADADHAVLSRLHARIRGKASAISPLILNIGRPTPAIGWQNKEVASFLDRAAGYFDCVLILGLIHHLLVSERATLRMIAELLNRLNLQRVILEWVDPQDQKFRQLAGLNAELYGGLSTDQLESCMQPMFRLTEKIRLPCATRVLYVWDL